MDESPTSKSGLAGLSDTHIQIGAGAIVALLALMLFWLRFCGDVELPAPPAGKKVVATEGLSGTRDGLRRLSGNRDSYVARLGDDTGRFGLKEPATLANMAVAFEHRVDTKRHSLRPGKGTARVAGLILSTVVREGMLALRIENTLDKPVAYFIRTKPERGFRRCKRKTHFPHNALALSAAGHEDAVVVRSECKNKRGKGLRVERVEVAVLPELGYFYLSQVHPRMIGQRLPPMRNHRGTGPGSEICNDNISASLEAGIEAGEISWFDMIDFYARHPCNSFRFPEGYTAFSEDNERPLPAN